MNSNDERMHPVRDEPAWSESYYFNFVDPVSKLAMFTRMGFRPGDGWADGLHVVYLGGQRVAFTYGRRAIGKDLPQYDGDLCVGGLRLDCIDPFGSWRVNYEGDAQDIADAAILLARSKTRPANWFQPARLQMAVEFSALYPPHYAGEGARGHFEQTGRVHGDITIDGVTHRVDGYGVRDKSWGPRDWGATNAAPTAPLPDNSAVAQRGPAPFVNWFSMNFGAGLAIGGACGRAADGVMRGSGWLQRAGVNEDLTDVVIESTYRGDSILHKSLRLTAKSSGRAVIVEGDVLTVCPTKIPMPGGATVVNEGLAEFRCEGRTGYGISEHWHRVS